MASVAPSCTFTRVPDCFFIFPSSVLLFVLPQHPHAKWYLQLFHHLLSDMFSKVQLYGWVPVHFPRHVKHSSGVWGSWMRLVVIKRKIVSAVNQLAFRTLSASGSAFLAFGAGTWQRDAKPVRPPLLPTLCEQGYRMTPACCLQVTYSVLSLGDWLIFFCSTNICSAPTCCQTPFYVLLIQQWIKQKFLSSWSWQSSGGWMNTSSLSDTQCGS